MPSEHPFPPEVEQACVDALKDADEHNRVVLVNEDAVRIVLAKLAEFGEWETGTAIRDFTGVMRKPNRRWTLTTPWQEAE